ncbi:hypothetical protein STEG23_037350, partial [Scotinomys teguina]
SQPSVESCNGHTPLDAASSFPLLSRSSQPSVESCLLLQSTPPPPHTHLNPCSSIGKERLAVRAGLYIRDTAIEFRAYPKDP